MRNDHWNDIYTKLLTPEIVALLAQIHEYKGEQSAFIATKADTLTRLVEMAKIQSLEASNKIEGIYTSDERLKRIVREKVMPKTSDEKEMAGYRDVLSVIHESYDFIPVKPAILLQLHRDLYKYSGLSIGGTYKNFDSMIPDEDEFGKQRVRFQPVPASETPQSIEAICSALDEASKNPAFDTLLLIPIFILDFLCIHPFHDGNGRMSRLLTLLLLYRAGYHIGQYISIEKMIEQTKESYYEALCQSSDNWHEGTNDYLPFTRYLLGMIVAAYREFNGHIQTLMTSGISKPERVRSIVKDALGKITKSEIVKHCPDISLITVERTLNELLKNGEIIKVGGGRYTSYIWNRENET